MEESYRDIEQLSRDESKKKKGKWTVYECDKYDETF